MKFFIPFESDPQKAEVIFEAIAKFMADEMGPVRSQRYFRIYYKHNGEELVATVGDPEPLTGEVVIAILRTERDNGPFLICTPKRGVRGGHPVLADGSPYTRAIHFEDY